MAAGYVRPLSPCPTIEGETWSRLPAYTLPPTYRLQDGSGNGCYGDPPGYPTYFTRSVYTRYGNGPRRGPSLLLFGRVVETGTWKPGETWETRRARQDTLMRRLWIPVPLDHPRTRLWVLSLYAHHQTHYLDPNEPGEYGRGQRDVFYPVPDWRLPKRFTDDARFSEEWREKERAAVEQANAEFIARERVVAVPDNHAAVVHIRKFYPAYVPELDLIDSPPVAYQQDWWTTCETRPETDQECQATCRTGIRMPHAEVDAKEGTSFCRWCGYGIKGDGAVER